MLSLTILASLTTSALSLAIPQTTTGGNYYPVSLNTTVYYYTGSTSSNICNMNVGSGTMQQGVCNTMKLSGYGIQQSCNHNCTFTMYAGSTSCDVDATERIVYQVPAGEDVVCVGSDVLDGGMYQHASGVWSCA